jgi:hypothetical protein
MDGPSVVLCSLSYDLMRRLFQLFGRGEPAVHLTQFKCADLKCARLAANSTARGSANDCLWLQVSSSRTIFALMEAGGRGEQKRELLASADGAIRQSAPELLSGDTINEADAMVEICSRLNRALLQTSKRIVSCTTFCGCYNDRFGTVCYFNAGHVPALLDHNGTITELAATGLPLGLFSHSTPDAPTVAVPPGATLLVSSRRLIHARNRRNQFGFGRLRQTLQSQSGARADDFCAALSAELQGFMGKHHVHEMSFLALTREAVAVAAAG